MTTGDFVKSITSNNIGEAVLQCFDEIMVLYYMLGNREDIKIYTNSTNIPASFTVSMNSEKDISKLYNDMNGLDFSVYGEKYVINMTDQKSTSMEVVIERAS